MDWTKRINGILDYIEENLDGEISNELIAQMAGCSIYNFQRMFSYIAELSLGEYIRSRRLTMAAFDLVRSGERIIDIALRYGYESHDAFTRAFQRYHGVLPSKVRQEAVKLRSCPKLSFHLIIKGGEGMEYQIQQHPAFTVTGYRKKVKTAEAYQAVPVFWEEAGKNGNTQRLAELWQACGKRPGGILGIALGGSWGGAEEMAYYLAATTRVEGEEGKTAPIPEGLESLEIPAATWVVVECKGSLPDSIQNVYKDFYSQWLPSSGYQLADVPVIESYFPDRQEVWIGVESGK